MRIAITGGIGSGKSFFCRQLELRGVSVYDCDAAAKRLMASDESLKEALCRTVGNNCYQGGQLQKRVLAQFVLHSEANKRLIDSIVHPAVALDFLHSGFSWLESAILFDSGFVRRVDFDLIVGVAAPLEVRIERIMQRDNISRTKALQWIECQWPQEKVMERCDVVVNNDGKNDLGQVADLLLATVEKYKNDNSTKNKS